MMPDRERQAGPVEHPAEDVAPLGIGPQEESRPRLDQVGVLEVAGDRVMGRQPGREHRRDHHYRDEEEAQLKEPIPPQPLP